jgi:hypothetical protein
MDGTHGRNGRGWGLGGGSEGVAPESAWRAVMSGGVNALKH